MTNLPPPPPSLPPPPPPLPYSARTGGVESLTEILLSTTFAATTRNEEATLLFQNIACILDDAYSEDGLPQHLQKPFRNFVADLNMVARRHFECHIRGSPRPPLPYSSAATESKSASIPTGKTISIAVPVTTQHQKPRSYASAAIAAPKRPQFGQPSKQPVRTQPKPARVDDRLLVRVSPDHPSLRMSPYAIMLKLNSFLKEKLVLEIQSTKTGFAICPISTAAQEALIARMSEIDEFLSTSGKCKVEKPTNHKAYLISGVPRSYAGYNGSEIELVEITASTIAEALLELTNVAPINVLEPRNASKAEFAAHKDWIVLYPEESSPLSRNLPLFGIRIQAKLLPKRTKLPQCGKCFGWHNERACCRAPRCRICGSTQHPESQHTSCDPTRVHQCPPKCVNCHGPHTADSLECLIRPRKDQSLPTKSQIAEIRKTAAAARLRLKIAHCGALDTKNFAVTETSASKVPAVPSVPTASKDLFSEQTSPALTCGRYAPLENESCDFRDSNSSRMQL
ncbi:hypothetical protein K3495_g10367 [Podosphaera aphanis]|nr:hypothetical protein K3495_g10367 [Podosphaera aphanis]